MQPDFDDFPDNERFQDDSEDDYTGSERDESDWRQRRQVVGRKARVAKVKRRWRTTTTAI
jgi:hypothetical protein